MTKIIDLIFKWIINYPIEFIFSIFEKIYLDFLSFFS